MTTERRAFAPLWFAAGLLSVGIGGIGVVVPGLPTTVFFIIAAACFSRSNKRFEQWVLDLPKIGRLVRDHRDGLGMPRRAKVMAVTMILVVATARRGTTTTQPAASRSRPRRGAVRGRCAGARPGPARAWAP